jgi:hypothetical protein
MDYGKAIKFTFDDKDWIGIVLIGGALGLVSLLFVWTIIIPILIGALFFGYMMQLVRDVRQNPNAGLPAWTDWGKKLGDGFKLMIVQFIWAIPIFLLLIPIAFLGILLSFYPDSDTLAILLSLATMTMVFLAILYGVILSFMLPAITINLAVKENFSAGLELGAIFKITKTHFVDILIMLILLYGISYIANWVGVLLFVIGVFFTSFWVMLVKGHLLGQLARLALPADDENATDLAIAAPTQPVPVTD